MRMLLSLIFGLLFSGCAVLSAGLQGAGQGLQKSVQEERQKSRYCNSSPDGAGGFTTYCD